MTQQFLNWGRSDIPNQHTNLENTHANICAARQRKLWAEITFCDFWNNKDLPIWLCCVVRKMLCLSTHATYNFESQEKQYCTMSKNDTLGW